MTEEILGSFMHILSEQGYGVETAETGHEAIEKCKSGSHDLALLDINLPIWMALSCSGSCMKWTPR